MREVIEGLSDVKELLAVNQVGLSFEDTSVVDQMDMLTSTSGVIRSLIQDLQATPEGELAPSQLKEYLDDFAAELEKADEIAANVKATHHRRRLRDAGEAANEGMPTSSHHEKMRKYTEHPKIKRHLEMHDKIKNGDLSFLDHYVDRMSQSSHASKGHRALGATPEWKESCKQMVSCIKNYSLFDFVAYFWGPFTNEDGEIEKDKMDPNVAVYTSSLEATLGSIRDALKKVESYYSQSNCEALLKHFHTNGYKKVYDEAKAGKYNGASWRDVCRAEGSTQYIKLSQIYEHVDQRAAYQILEDMGMCASLETATPSSLATQMDGAKRGRPCHTRSIIGLTKEINILEFHKRFKDYDSWTRRPNFDFLGDHQKKSCYKAVNSKYRQHMESHS
ncbi:expressed unknown protein [Seminavis robusta]|uniref:Uncharacterized protein n=1 Tax=Seminavis robusta TaxID=568900 RepID=A0A9N8D584_9STRA|nr:expressed unknown protein [Seminavis robusta]|eukprot:Sro7_g006080.1 n/a (390) ;mRNA; r:143130-145232